MSHTGTITIASPISAIASRVTQATLRNLALLLVPISVPQINELNAVSLNILQQSDRIPKQERVSNAEALSW